jgi:hypothetical protein
MYDANKSQSTISTRDFQIYVAFGYTFGSGEVNVLTNTSAQVKTNTCTVSGGPAITISATINGYENLNLRF